LREELTKLLRRNEILTSKLKTANYWPFLKWDIIGMSAINFKIIRFELKILLLTKRYSLKKNVLKGMAVKN